MHLQCPIQTSDVQTADASACRQRIFLDLQSDRRCVAEEKLRTWTNADPIPIFDNG